MSQERRRAKRHPILDTFSVFVVVPKKGPNRLALNNISTLGLGFYIDTEGEDPSDFRLKQGEELQVHIYLNQSLYLPMDIVVTRMHSQDGSRFVGADYKDLKSKHYKALNAFVTLVEELNGVGQITQG